MTTKEHQSFGITIFKQLQRENEMLDRLGSRIRELEICYLSEVILSISVSFQWVIPISMSYMYFGLAIYQISGFMDLYRVRNLF